MNFIDALMFIPENLLLPLVSQFQPIFLTRDPYRFNVTRTKTLIQNLKPSMNSNLFKTLLAAFIQVLGLLIGPGCRDLSSYTNKQQHICVSQVHRLHYPFSDEDITNTLPYIALKKPFSGEFQVF